MKASCGNRLASDCGGTDVEELFQITAFVFTETDVSAFIKTNINQKYFAYTLNFQLFNPDIPRFNSISPATPLDIIPQTSISNLHIFRISSRLQALTDHCLSDLKHLTNISLKSIPSTPLVYVG